MLADGKLLGNTDGLPEGSLDGDKLGSLLGSDDGIDDGELLGPRDGTPVGC